MTKKLLGLLVAAMAVISFGCTDPTASGAQLQFSGADDTVISLATPSVRAIAYPGYNLVTWDPVPNNYGYEVYRYEGNGNTYWTDKKLSDVESNSGDKLYYEDTDVQNGVTYRYTVMARGTLGGSRALAVTDSAVGSATCVGIMPPLNTSALELAAYEGGYKEGVDKEMTVTEEKLKLTRDEIESNIDDGETSADLGRIAVRFNAKAYLDYSMTAVKGNCYDITKIWDKAFGKEYDTVVNNSYLTLNNLDGDGVGIKESGEYTVWVKAAAKNKHFIKADYVQVIKKVTVPELVTQEAPSFTLKFKDANKDVVKISCTKLDYENKEFVDKSYYKFYKAEYNTKKYEQVTVVEKEDEDDNYIWEESITPVPDTIKYEYMLVVTDGTRYCKKATPVEFEYTAP